MTTNTIFPTCTIADDGAVSLTSGVLAITALYPALDGEPLRAAAVIVERRAGGGDITWRLAGGGSVGLEVRNADQGMQLRLRLTGVPHAPRSLGLCQRAQVSGAARIWCMAQGMGGGAGLHTADDAAQRRSHGLTACFAADGSGLGAWAEHHHAFPLVATWEAGRFSAAFTCEGVPLPDGGLIMPVVHWVADTAGWQLITGMAQAIADAAHCLPRERRLTWCSWYYFYHHFCRRDLDEVLTGLRSMSDRGGIAVVQVDAGYCTSLGDWLEPNHLWPGGLQSAFGAIAAAGFIPGIWIGPFMVGSRSRVAREHQDWLLRDLDGTLLAPIRNYGEHRLWHYPDEEYHVLDTSHPDAFAYLRQVIRTLVAWGAQHFKTDFIYWGMPDSATVRRARPGRTSSELVREVMTMIREELGPERYLLGCIAPYGPCLGLVDGMRIAGDIGPQWSGGFNPQNMLEESLHTLAVEGRWFQSDPDALLVRDFHSGFLDHEVVTLALWQAMTGGNLCTSDPLHRCSPARQALWRFCDSTHAGPAFVPAYGAQPAERIVMRDLGDRRWAVLACNTGEEPRRLRLPIATWLGLAAPWIHPWGPVPDGAPSATTTIDVDLPAHTARLWLVADRRLDRLPATLSG